MELGKKVLEKREESNISQKQLAKQLGISKKQLIKWETCEEVPNIQYINKLFKETKEKENQEFFTELALLKQTAETLQQQCKEKDPVDLSVLVEQKDILSAQKDAAKQSADIMKQENAVFENPEIQ